MNENLRSRLLKEIALLKPSQLLCEVEISYDEFYQLIEYSKEKIKINKTSSFNKPDELLSLTLVQIGIREYDDRRF